VETLYVWSDHVTVVDRESLTAVRHLDDGERAVGIPFRYRNHDVSKIQVLRLGRRMLGKLVRARRQTDINVHAQTTAAREPSGVGNAVTGAKNGLVFLSPGKGPAQADGRCEVVPVVLIEQLIRLRRVLADKFHRGQLTPDSGLVPVRKARPREPE